MPRQRYSRGTLKQSQTKPKKWLGDWYRYETVDGQEKRIHRGPKIIGLCSKMTKSEAQAELDRMIAEDRTPESQRPEEITVEGAIRQYIGMKKGSWSEASKETNAWLADKKLIPALGKFNLRAVTRPQLQAYLNDLAEKGASKSFLQKARQLLMAVFDEMLEQDHIEKNPARKLEMPRSKKVKCSRFLTDEECTKLLAACTGREHLILRLAMVCGFRPGELFALRRSDVYPGKLLVDETAREGVLKPGAKTEGSEGFVAIPPSLEVELRAWMRERGGGPNDLLFPSNRPGAPIRWHNYLRRYLVPIAKAAGIEGLNFQALRRTTATHAQKVGSMKDVQSVMRHTTPAMTIGVYMQELSDSTRATVAALDAKIGGGAVQ